MTSSLLVGIAGRKRSGKTALAHLLCEQYRMHHTSFAAPMRRFVRDLLGCTKTQLEEHKEAPIAWLDGKSPRTLLQTLGTEWGRNLIHPAIWVRVALRDALAHDAAVISDVRFHNEADAIHEHGGIIIRLHRPGSGDDDTHESEAGLPDSTIDFELQNTGSLESLLAQASACLSDRLARLQTAREMVYGREPPILDEVA